MAITRVRIWYVCNNCGEWFCYPDDKIPEKCPDCNKGTLIKTCADCSKIFSNCDCVDKK